MQVDLNLGSADLSSDPADADFELSGNGRHWQGKLPTKIEDVPTGNYSLAVSRKGWELNKDISISRGSVTTNKTEFQYGSIEVTSDPTGLTISTNGVDIGKTPLTLHGTDAAVEMQHTFAAGGAFFRPHPPFLQNADEGGVEPGINRFGVETLGQAVLKAAFNPASKDS